MDISADLIELGRTPMGVICAGAKSILDIPRTLEVLETQGVCVASYGQKEFPAFYTPSSGVKVCPSSIISSSLPLIAMLPVLPFSPHLLSSSPLLMFLFVAKGETNELGPMASRHPHLRRPTHQSVPLPLLTVSILELTTVDTGLTLPTPLATLLAVPPLPSTNGQKVQEAVEQAVRESREQGVDKRGKEATPWLLKRVGELSGGMALDLSTYRISLLL